MRLTPRQVPTLIGLIAMTLAVLLFGWDVGLVTITISIVLAAINPTAGKAAMSKVSWPVVILICGVLTYIGVLQAAGTVEWVSTGISAIGIPLLAALLLFYLAGFVSALASSLAIIGVVIALAVPLLESGDIHAGGFVAPGDRVDDRRHQPVLYERRHAPRERPLVDPRPLLPADDRLRRPYVPPRPRPRVAHRRGADVVGRLRAHVLTGFPPWTRRAATASEP